MSSRIGGLRGPPFVEVEGNLYLNLAFDLPPYGKDVRLKIAAVICPKAPAESLMLLRLLTDEEARLVREYRVNGDVEAWAKITA